MRNQSLFKCSFLFAVALFIVLAFGCSKDDLDPTTAVTGISVDKLSLALGVNDQEMLIATVSPENASNKNVSWVSSDPTVISVIDGKIIALANGSVTVTVTTEDGNFTATCVVNVSLLGRVSFRTDRTWEFGSQIWSDAVIATGSKMNGFDGGTYGSSEYKVDCMHNPPYGDWFSWKAVEEYKELLCPNGWRVPTADDFYNLDIALGGDGKNHLYLDSSPAPYIEEWGGEYGGYVWRYNGEQVIDYKDSYACYWSQTEANDAQGCCLNLGTSYGYRIPRGMSDKYNGFSVRCVKDRE